MYDMNKSWDHDGCEIILEGNSSASSTARGGREVCGWVGVWCGWIRAIQDRHGEGGGMSRSRWQWRPRQGRRCKRPITSSSRRSPLVSALPAKSSGFPQMQYWLCSSDDSQTRTAFSTPFPTIPFYPTPSPGKCSRPLGTETRQRRRPSFDR